MTSEQFVNDMIDEVIGSSVATEEAVDLMMSREREFPSALAATLAAIGVRQESRQIMDEILAEEWIKPWDSDQPVKELVIGAGPHALIYAAVRARQGVKVTVVERAKVGGVFAMSNGPAFWLNSRNRPGEAGVPGEGRGLNVLSGCPIQPSMISGGEYQTNDEMAWTIRANFALLGVEVHTGVEVLNISPDEEDGEEGYIVETSQGSLFASRVVIANGLGDPNRWTSDQKNPRWERVVQYPEFMAKMDSPFPLRGMDRVAVIGAGDSGKTTVEALLGQGPSTKMSVSTLDFPTQIDWYGCEYRNRESWCQANRGRYSKIGMALGNRVQAKAGKARYFPIGGFESAMMGPLTYDWVIDCTGFKREGTVSALSAKTYKVGSKSVARQVEESGYDNVFRIGPCANLEVSELERQTLPALSQVSENVASLFRYAPLTAAFARALPQVGS